jgi:hypothetical protein
MRSTGAITTVECAGSPASKTLSRESRDGVGGVGVGGAQLCKSGKAGAASSVVARARSSKDGPAPATEVTVGQRVLQEETCLRP